MGDQITNGKGVNKGIYFNLHKIDNDKIMFYLRISFDRGQIEFKLENDGSSPSKELGDKYWKLINENKSDENIIKSSYRSSKQTMTIAKIDNFIRVDSKNKIKFNETKLFIESIVDLHDKLTVLIKL